MILEKKPFLTLSDLEKLPKLQRDALLRSSRYIWRWDAESNRLLNMRHADNAPKQPKQHHRSWQEPQHDPDQRSRFFRPKEGQNFHVYQRTDNDWDKKSGWVQMRVVQWDARTVFVEHPETFEEIELSRSMLKKHGYDCVNLCEPGERWFYTVKEMQETIKCEDETATMRAASRAKAAALRALAFGRSQDEIAILPIPPGADRATIMRVFRERAKVHHPDHGGDPDNFRRLCSAKDKALAEATLK